MKLNLHHWNLTKDLACLGSGAYGSVYRLDKTTVLKVCNEADIYVWYAKYCFANPHPNLPKIYSIKHVNSVVLITLKKYVPTCGYDELLNYYNDLRNKWKHQLYSNPSKEHPLHGFVKYLKETQALSNRKFTIGSKNNEHYIRWDLHSSNVMVDPDTKELIITDPLAGLTKANPNRRQSCKKLPLFAPKSSTKSKSKSKENKSESSKATSSTITSTESTPIANRSESIVYHSLESLPF